mgnify:CR=1 FL=1
MTLIARGSVTWNDFIPKKPIIVFKYLGDDAVFDFIELITIKIFYLYKVTGLHGAPQWSPKSKKIFGSPQWASLHRDVSVNTQSPCVQMRLSIKSFLSIGIKSMPLYFQSGILVGRICLHFNSYPIFLEPFAMLHPLGTK